MNVLIILVLCVWAGGFLCLCRRLIPMLVYDRATMPEQLQAVAIWLVWPVSLPIIRVCRAYRQTADPQSR